MHNNQKEGGFEPLHSMGTQPPALVYANLPQPGTLSLNQWISPPETGRGLYTSSLIGVAEVVGL